MYTLPKLHSFQITFKGGSYINETLDQLEHLPGLYDITTIDTISFYFQHDNTHEIRNIILRNIGHRLFKVVFFTYYDENRQLVELHLDQKILGYAALLHELNQIEDLYDYLGQYILCPFELLTTSSV